jgi:glycosyltransferase involved in cell wall biosynthesis
LVDDGGAKLSPRAGHPPATAPGTVAEEQFFRVSVVIPYFNGSKFIERAIASVFAQTMPPMEVLVVDDGSTETESDFLDQLRLTYPLRVVHQANQGQSAARNLGISLAQGTHICLLDQDDYFLEWHIEHLVEVARGQADARFAFAYGDLWRGSEGGAVFFHSWLDKFPPHPKVDLETFLRQDSYIIPSATLIDKDAFLAVGGFDVRLIGYEDEDLFSRFFRQGYTSVFSPRPVTFWTFNNASASNSILLARSRWIYFEKLLDSYPDIPEANRYVLRDWLVPRFTYPFIDDFLKSCFLRDEFIDENRERLSAFVSRVKADPSCGRFARKMGLIALLLKLRPHTVVRWATFASSPVGGVMLGNLGKRTFRPRIRELILMSTHA